MRLVIIGAGFAGMYAALSAARLRDIEGVSPAKLEIALVAPEPTLVVRPRLYEPKPETLTAPLLDVLKAVEVAYVQGRAEIIDTKARSVGLVTADGKNRTLPYDRLVVATGSRLFRPNIPGLAEHGINIAAVFDKDPELVGRDIGSATVLDASRLASVVREKSIVVGVIAVPADAAQEATDELVSADVKIIFNYSEALLQVPPEVTVHTSSPAVDLLYALYFYLT